MSGNQNNSNWSKRDQRLNTQFKMFAAATGCGAFASLFVGFWPSMLAYVVPMAVVQTPILRKHREMTGEGLSTGDNVIVQLPGLLVGGLIGGSLGIQDTIDLTQVHAVQNQEQVYTMSADKMHKPIDMTTITVPAAKV